ANHTVDTAQFLNLVEILGVLLAGQLIWTVRAELRRALERERRHSRQEKTDDWRRGIAGVRLPDSGERRRRNECWIRAAAVVLAQRNNCLGHAFANHDAVRLRFPFRDRIHVVVINSGESVRLNIVKATRQAYQRVVRWSCDTR